MSDGMMNLTIARSDKSVWDKPGFGATLASYDQERWMTAACGSVLAMIGARRGGFAGGLVAGAGLRQFRRVDGLSKVVGGGPEQHRVAVERQARETLFQRGQDLRGGVVDQREVRDEPRRRAQHVTQSSGGVG